MKPAIKAGFRLIGEGTKAYMRQLLQLITDLNITLTSCMGCLFDAASSLIGIRHNVDYEAQAAIELEAISAKFRIMRKPTSARLIVSSRADVLLRLR